MPCRILAITHVRSTLLQSCLAITAAAVLALFAPLQSANAQCSSSNGTESSYSNADGAFSTANQVNGNYGQSDPASLYPSSITVPSTVTGTVGCVQIELDGITGVTSSGGNNGQSLYNMELILVAPNGSYLMVYGGVGQPDAISNLDMTIGDGYTVLGNANTGNDFTTTSCNSGALCTSLGPQSYLLLGNYLVVPNQGGAPQSFSSSNNTLPTTDGTATMASVFNNGTAAGTWKLYMADFYGDPVSVTGWKLHVWTKAVAASTTTVSSNANPAAGGSSVTLTSTTTTGGAAVPGGTVDFYYLNSTSGSASTIAGCTGVAVNASGQAACTKTLSLASGSTCTTIVTGSSASQTLPAYPTVCPGNQTVYAVYNGDSGANIAASTSGDLALVVPSTQTHSGNQWCSTSALTLLNNGTSITYPSYITVSGYAAGTTVSDVSVSLSTLQGSQGINGQYLLVSPDGKNLDFMDDAFNASSQGPVNLTIEDDGGQQPTGNASSGSYLPYDNNLLVGDNFPSPASLPSGANIPAIPGTINHPAPTGSSSNTFANSFNGAAANGVWALYATSANSQGTQIASGGWCIDLTPNTGVGTATKITSTQNPTQPNTSITYTAAVTSGGSPVTSGGTVTFLDNDLTPGGTTSGNNVVNLGVTGTATFSSSSLYDQIDIGATNDTENYTKVYEGDHTISGSYSGSTSDNPSEGTLVERIDNATTLTSTGTNAFSACNAGPIYSSQGNKGPFTPNPSNIFVSNLPGTINTVSLTLGNFYTNTADVVNDVESMVEGPTKAALDFFSGTGGSTPGAVTTGNYTFSDSAGSSVPSSSFGPGTYKPTSYLSNDAFTSSASGFYNTPPSFQYSAPQGSGTFTSTFGNTNPNGTWSLFFNMSVAQNVTGATNGWCLNFTENAPTVAASENHSGTGVSNDFIQGETNAQLITTVTNTGNGPTGDPTGTNPLKVTDTLNSALTYTGFSGSGWSCSTSGQTVTCTNDSAVAQSSAYPALTINVNVSTSFTGNITNSITASGAGAAQVTASDTIKVDAAPVLSIVKSHTGTFTQGATAQWTLQVSNIAANGTTSGTITVSDPLPTGYTLNSYSSTGSLWTCSGTSAVTCTASPGLSAGTTATITLTVNVPANSPISVSNIAQVWGGGDLVHSSPATAASSNTDTATVAQVPASIALTSGSGEGTLIGTAFPNPLVATVTDAASNPVAGVTVIFTAPSGLTASLVFSNASTTESVVTNGAGQASSGTITANSVAGGPYNVQVSLNSLANNFQVTNLRRSLTSISNLTATSTTLNVFGFGFAAPSGQLSFTDITTGNPIVAPITLNTANAAPTLQPMTSVSTGTNTLPDWTEIADINGDGKPDLITSLYETDSISVQLGNGDGTFQTATTTLIASGFGPAESHLVSLRGNGILDLIVGSFNINQIAVLLGNGNGTFQSPVFYTVGSANNWPSSLTTGDFNHDGNLDVATANTGDNTISIFYGNGSGALTAAGSPIAVGKDPEAIRSGDFNADGYSDLATVNYEDGTVTTLLNNLDGTFTASAISVGSGADSGPQALAITGTGANLKLATANYLDNTVSVMQSNGSGAFGTQTIVSVGKGPDDVSFTDLNGDSLPDLVVSNYTDSTVTLLLAQSGGSYTNLGSFAVGKNPYSAAVGDIDLDGTPDIVTSNCFSNSTGTLLSGVQISTPLTGLSLTTGDSVQAAYTHNGNSQYADSSSSTAAAPAALSRSLLSNGVQKSRKTTRHE